MHFLAITRCSELERRDLFSRLIRAFGRFVWQIGARTRVHGTRASASTLVPCKRDNGGVIRMLLRAVERGGDTCLKHWAMFVCLYTSGACAVRVWTWLLVSKPEASWAEKKKDRGCYTDKLDRLSFPFAEATRSNREASKLKPINEIVQMPEVKWRNAKYLMAIRMVNTRASWSQPVSARFMYMYTVPDTYTVWLSLASMRGEEKIIFVRGSCAIEPTGAALTRSFVSSSRPCRCNARQTDRSFGERKFFLAGRKNARV